MPSKTEIWAQWDKAWDLGLPAEKRLELLKNATAAGFAYTNPTSTVSNDLEALAQLIGDLLQKAENKITVKHLKWYEHHDSCVLHWDMINVDTKELAVHGWSYGNFAEDWKLLAVIDFW